jgi:hypothetical protein
MNENAFLESLNAMSRFFPENGEQIEDVIKKAKPKVFSTSVRLSGDVNSILDLLAHRFDCSKGKIIKTVLEVGIFQLAGEHGLLEGGSKVLFDAITLEEKKRQQQLHKN